MSWYGRDIDQSISICLMYIPIITTDGSPLGWIAWEHAQDQITMGCCTIRREKRLFISGLWITGATPCNSNISLQWRHNGRDGVSNHQPYDCLFNSSFRCRSKKTSKFRVTDLCEGHSPVTGEFLAQVASNAKNISIWWRHHVVPFQKNCNV